MSGDGVPYSQPKNGSNISVGGRVPYGSPNSAETRTGAVVVSIVRLEQRDCTSVYGSLWGDGVPYGFA